LMVFLIHSFIVDNEDFKIFELLYKNKFIMKMSLELFFVFTDSCVHCNNFKQNHLESLTKELNIKLPELKLINVNMKDKDPQLSKIYQYSEWFPNFILAFNRNSVNEKIVIFNGSIIDNKPKLNDIIVKLNSENIIDWCVNEYTKINNISNTIFNLTTNMNTLQLCFKYISDYSK